MNFGARFKVYAAFQVSVHIIKLYVIMVKIGIVVIF